MRHRDDLEAILRATPGLMHVMETARALDLPDWLVFSGAIYQPVLNHLTGRPADHGIKDYDLAYFDPDTAYEAEDAVIRRVAQAFEPPFREMVEVRNQARVHLWFEAKFGEPYGPPLVSSADALSRFASPLNAVAARLEADGSMTVLAPFGLEDLFSMTYRANPNRRVSGFALTSGAAQRRWPELTVIPQE